MQDNNIREKCRELATRLYELDGEVYKSVGSSLGRTFTGDREGTIRNLSALMYTKPDGHLLRSEMALISNMARTIKDKDEKSRLMKKYDEIFQEILTLPETFVTLGYHHGLYLFQILSIGTIRNTPRCRIHTQRGHGKDLNWR